MTNSTVQSVEKSPQRAFSHEARCQQLAIARLARKAENTRHTAFEKDNFLILWLYRFGVSSPKVLSLVSGDRTKSSFKRLLGDKKIQLFTPNEGFYTQAFRSEDQLISLTRLGVGIARNQLGQDLNYSEHQPSKVKCQQVGHSLEIQLAIYKLLSDSFFVNFKSERQQAVKAVKGGKRFDAIISTKANTVIAIEVETSRKGEKDLSEMQQRMLSALQELKSDGSNLYDEIILFVHPSFIKAYRQSFRPGVKVHAYSKSDSGKYYPSSVVCTISTDDSARIRITEIDGNFKQ